MPARSGVTPVPADEFVAPARRALAGAGCTTPEDLAAVPEAAVAELHGVGPSALDTLREVLEEHGLSFPGTSESGEPPWR